MSSPLILFIETSSTVCSVALAENKKILSVREVNNGYTHSELLHVFCKELMQETGKEFSNLNAIGISTGPGSYTGLRIGMSAAKGFCFALGIPLIGISTLENLTVAAMRKIGNSSINYFIPLIDARRMEVYQGIFDVNLQLQQCPSPLVVTADSVKLFEHYTPAVFFGSGVQKCKPLLSCFENSIFIEDILSSSQNMIEIGFNKFNSCDFLDVAYCEPDYLKEFFDTRKS